MNNNSIGAAPTANLNERIRVSLMRLAARNGNLRELTSRARLSYPTIWNQINRQHGVLAASVPPIVKATGDATLLSIIADAAGFMVAPKPKFKRTKQDVRKQGVGLAIAVGRALDIIEQALADGKINSLDREDIHRALSDVCAHSVSIGEIVEKGTFLRKRDR